jgi:hypothetical protein
MDHLMRRVGFVVGAIMLGHLVLYFVFNAEAMMPRNKRLGDRSSSEVRNSCYVAPWRLRDPELPQYPSDFVTPPEAPAVREMTAGLFCQVVTKHDAVCDPDNRAYIVDFIGRYYGKREAMLATAKSKSAEQLDMMQRFWNSRRNQQIDAAIAAAIRDGKLHKSDFGWSPPAALKPLLSQYAKAPDRCPPQRSATPQS